MINENIKKYRKAKGMSQEEMAVKLNVVRQTISKWENGLSVPDSEILIDIAKLLDVPVSKLLGTQIENDTIDDLTAELSRVNEELANKNRRQALVKRANEKRGIILFLSFVSMLVMLGIKNQVVSIVLSAACIITALIILYCNLALLTSVTTDDFKIKTVRFATIFNIMVLIVCAGTALLSEINVIKFSENGEKIFATMLVSCIMIVFGIIAQKLPFTRHTGLRLPWTVRDEEAWNIAHKIISYISLPLALIYIACALTIEKFKAITLIALLFWVGIPSLISYIFFRKKYYKKSNN